ncbi:MAG: serine/threonine protein kinase [Clostridia bacterium]|nr:serine/threonine protein kinase [Clostridia bacterium]
MFEQYDAVKALKEPDLYLIKDCSSGMLAVRKRTRTELLSVYGQLSDIDINGIPRIFSIEQDGQYLSIIREYIPGKTLAEALREGVRFSEKEATEKIIALCDILSVVHSLTPPIIHRDIKPSNIILQEDGGICLIDFDAARQYKGDGGGDTQHIGTHGYAAPEQYGFGETDARADIYAVGILLKELLGESISPHLNEIIAACTRMDPAHRYQSAAALKRALAGKKRIRKGLAVGTGVMVLCVALAGALIRGGQEVEPEIVYLEESDPTGKLAESPIPEKRPDDPWLDIPYPGYYATRSFSTIYDYAQLKEALNTALEKPNMLYELIVEGNVIAEESVTIPLNMELIIPRGGALRMMPGTTLTNGGFINVEGNGESFGTLELMDNSSLYCCNMPDEGLLMMEIEGLLQCGSNVSITREEVRDRSQSPLINLREGAVFRCADADSLSVSGYRLFFLATTAEFPMEVFERTKGIGNPAEMRFYDISSLEELFSAFDDARTKYRYFICSVDVCEDITIDRNVAVPNNAGLNLFTTGVTISVAEGAELTIGSAGMQLERDTKLIVLPGGTLNYTADGIAFAEGAGIYAESGGTVNITNKELARELGFK